MLPERTVTECVCALWGECICIKWCYTSEPSVGKKKTHGGKAVLHSLVFASERSSNPVWSFSMLSLVACIFLKTSFLKTKRHSFFHSSLLSVLYLSIFFLFALMRGHGDWSHYVPSLWFIFDLSYSSSSVGRSSSRSRSSLGNGRLCVTAARRDTGLLSSSSSVGSSFTCTEWLQEGVRQTLVRQG